MPSAMVDPPLGQGRVLDRVVHIGEAQGLDPITRIRLELKRRRRDAADQAAAADRHDQGVQLRHGLQHLQASPGRR